jgi:hypothetical protein
MFLGLFKHAASFADVILACVKDGMVESLGLLMAGKDNKRVTRAFVRRRQPWPQASVHPVPPNNNGWMTVEIYR